MLTPKGRGVPKEVGGRRLGGLANRRANHANMHVRGYQEKGNINTPDDEAGSGSGHTRRRSSAICRSSAGTVRTRMGSTGLPGVNYFFGTEN